MKKTFIPRWVRSTLSACLFIALFATCKQDDPAPPAIALFDYYPTTNLVAPVSVTFYNKSTNATDYLWTYGNGQTDTDKDLSLKFNGAGSYVITLKATGKGGSDTYSRTITIDEPPTPKPVADFIYSPTTNLVAPQTITFTNTSTNADSYKWDFGDGTTSTTKSPTKEYAKEGTYTVKLTATGGGSTTDVSKNITIGKATPVTGQAVFWTDKSSGWSSIDVTVGGYAAGSITGYSTSAPACGSSKVVTVTGNPGTYQFTAKSNTGVTWSGDITITANQCRTQKLNFPTEAATGQVVFWTDKSSGWSSIDVTVNGKASGSITAYYTSAPSCNSDRNVTVKLSPGTYSYSARSNTGVTWSGTITITENQCGTFKLNFPDTPPPSNCDWTSANQCVKILKASTGTRCGTSNSVEVQYQNNCTSNIKVVCCLQRTDGTWSCSPDGTFDTGMKPNEKTDHYLCAGTGKYRIYSMPIADFIKNKCSYPKE